MTDLTELNKLEGYLRKNGIEYERIDQERELDVYGMAIQLERHQICVPAKEDKDWDVICHWGSYGYEEGLLELYGSLVTEKDGDSVAGWLTADDVIKRIESK